MGSRALWFAALAAVLVCLYRLYAPGLLADSGFDDDANLRGLANVNDLESALHFVLSGAAGPLGRPLALASFLLDAASWPMAPQAVLRTNTLIHLLNVILVMWLALRLAELLPRRPARPEWFGLCVALLWGSAPLLMSTSLMAVQRMTSLSGTCVLLGAIAWLAARGRLAESPWRAMTGMTLALGVGTVLAVLCKETGALLPLLIGVAELWLVAHALPPPAAGVARRMWRVWKVLFFLAPMLLLVAYAVQHLADTANAFQGRGYGPLQRLLTECRVLFAYLGQLLFPRFDGLGPFHDDYVLSNGWVEPPLTLAAAAGWSALLALAVWLRRGAWRVAGFGIAWFVTGHLLESTIFPLEPYFEHRNYVPAFGVFLVVCALLWERPGRGLWAGRALLCVLVINAALTGRELARAWGDPGVSGPRWLQAHPRSMRALMYHSRTTGMGGDLQRSVQIFDAAHPALQAQPEYIAARLRLYCGIEQPPRIQAAAEALDGLLRQGIVDYDTPESLGVAMDFAALGRCPGFDPERGRAALEAILLLPPERIMQRAVPVTHEVLARYWIRQRRLDMTMYHLEQAYALSGSTDTVLVMVGVLSSAGACDVARAVLEDAKPASWNPAANTGRELRLKAARELLAGRCPEPDHGG